MELGCFQESQSALDIGFIMEMYQWIHSLELV